MIPPPLWKCGTGIDNFCGSRLILLSSLFEFPVGSGLISWEKCQILWIVEESRGSSFSSRKSFENVHEVRTIFRASCGNPAWRQGVVLGLGKAECWLGTWVAPEVLAVSGSWNSLASDKEFTFFCKSWICINNWLTGIPLSRCMDNSSNLACLARSVSSQQILLNSSIYWQSFAWFSRKSLFLISNSPYKPI